MNNKQYQKNILLELLNLDEFKSSDFRNAEDVPIVQKEKVKKLSINDINSLDILANQLREKFSLNNLIIEGATSSNILFFYGKCAIQDTKILDGPMGDLFDKMLSSINLNREKIPISIINGRLTKKSYKRWKYFPSFSNYIFSKIES